MMTNSVHMPTSQQSNRFAADVTYMPGAQTLQGAAAMLQQHAAAAAAQEAGQMQGVVNGAARLQAALRVQGMTLPVFIPSAGFAGDLQGYVFTRDSLGMGTTWTRRQCHSRSRPRRLESQLRSFGR
jgi:orotidine-5'-phosphate decarboxylase